MLLILCLIMAREVGPSTDYIIIIMESSSVNIIISHFYTSWLPFQQIAVVSYSTGQCQSLWLSGRALAEIHIIHIIAGQPPIPDSSRIMLSYNILVHWLWVD